MIEWSSTSHGYLLSRENRIRSVFDEEMRKLLLERKDENQMTVDPSEYNSISDPGKMITIQTVHQISHKCDNDSKCDSSQLISDNRSSMHSPTTSSSDPDFNCPNHEFNNNTCTSSSSSSQQYSCENIIDIHRGSAIRLKVKVLVPVDDHPNVSSFIY